MAIADEYVKGVVADVTGVIRMIEQAQAQAARIVQRTEKLGGITIINDFDWDGVDVEKQDFIDALLAMQNDFPDILGEGGEALYRVIIGIV